MVDRRTKVTLDADVSPFSRGMSAASAKTAAFRRELDSTHTRMRDTDSSINQLTGRLSLLADLALSLGPAFAPIATAATPAVAGLVTQAGFAAAAAGTMVAAFQGVGDALDTLNDAQLDPTVENLQAAKDALQELSPAAGDLVVQLQSMRPEVEGLRDAAAEGLFPGLQRALAESERLFPRLEGILGEVGRVSGELAEQSIEALAGEEWRDFFAYVEREARPALSSLGETVGNVARGVSELWMAMDPLSDDWQSGLLDASERFAEWADSLSRTEGFQDFVQYVRETGPQVVDTLGSLSQTLIAIGEAAAPLGGPVLQAVESFADAIKSIAESDLGTPILGLATAVSSLRLALRGLQGLGGAVSGTAAGGFLGRRFAGTRASVQGLRSDVSGLAAGWATAGARTEREAARMSQASRSLRGNLRGVAGGAGRAGVAIGGLALAGSDVGDEFGFANTASLALMGTIAGPWGAAIGGGVGLMMDLASATNQAEEEAKSLEDALSRGDLASFVRQNEQLIDEETTSAHGFGGEPGNPAGIVGSFEVGRNQTDRARRAQRENRAAQAFANTLGTDLATASKRAQSALATLDVTWEDVVTSGVEGAQGYARAVQTVNSVNDSVPGRIHRVGEAVAGLDDKLLSTRESAGTLADALDSLLSPQLNLQQATDQWNAGLDDLNENVSEATGRVYGFEGATEAQREAIRKNREQVRGRIRNLQQMLVAEAEAGASSDELGRKMRHGRRRLLEAAEAAGLNRRQVRRMIDQMNLTPEAIRTVVNAETTQAERDVNAFQRSLRALDGDIATTWVYTKHATIGGGDAIRTGPGGRHLERAAGGTIPGPRSPYRDSVHVMAAPGEFFVSNEDGQADRWRRPLGAMNAGADDSTVYRETVQALREPRGYADGGTATPLQERVPVTPAPAPMTVQSPAQTIDYDRLAAAVAQHARPLYGDVHMQPHDYGDFTRIAREDAAAAGMDGARMGATG